MYQASVTITANEIDRKKNGNKLFPGKLFCTMIFIVQMPPPLKMNKIESKINAL